MAEALFDALESYRRDHRRPPVHSWHPERVGEIDIGIRRDGSWWHEGAPIERLEMVKLFASILRREGDRFFLVTPVEKLAINVEDAPFVVVDVERRSDEGVQQIGVRTNVDDFVMLDESHRLTLREPPPGDVGTDANLQPYVGIRDDLDALVNRAAYYRLAEFCVEDASGWYLDSCGVRFRLEAPGA